MFPEHLSSERPRSLLLSLGGAIQTLALGPILGPSRSHPGSEVVPSRFAMCFVLQCFGPIQVPRWGHPGPSWSHPAPERSLQDRAWTGRNRLLGHFRIFFKIYFCEPPDPVQGSKSPKPGKEGFGVEKPPFPTTPGKGQFVSMNALSQTLEWAIHWGRDTG